MKGWTLQQIADKLGWSSPSGVSYALKKARKELDEVVPLQELAELRRIHYQRLETLLQGVWPLAVGETVDGIPLRPDTQSLRLALRILDKQAELMGFNADSSTQTTRRRGR